MTRVQLRDNLGSERTDRWYSPNIWGDCPLEAILNGTVIGRVFQDDFTGPCPNLLFKCGILPQGDFTAVGMFSQGNRHLVLTGYSIGTP